jgi:hypothetical protein
MTNKKYVYKIRRKSDGLFSTGGTSPTFTKSGKSWASLGALKNHLNQAIHRDYGYRCYSDSKRETVRLFGAFLPYMECEIVAYEIVTVENTDALPFTIEGYFTDRMIIEANDMLRLKSPIDIVFPDGTKEILERK